MKTLKYILNYKNFILSASFISAIILSFSIISPAIAGVKQGIDMHANCVKTVFPDNVERDITIDPDGGTILVSYEENGLKKDITLSLKKDLKFSDCTDGVKELIALAQNTTDKINTDTCKELNEIVSGVQPVPSIDGKKMDMKAADNYIRNHC